ncbi:hypothetical protein C2S53_004326 [Perilla frutescens var. hirtella]|uniref:F-box domain-containing protein n=1 Tax=Perilla frutescens var. hirtella TaxID=608512 RepID=A0AAD4NXY6_PERFH|nr:hypothetical protein C2S53_004326 [Perilla frutescens var. hirtella]
MKKLKSNDDTLDRLSELPDALILKILSCLEMRDVFQTTLLSKRWKYLWVTLPFLYFNDEFTTDVNEIRNFINRALMLWNGTEFRKFKLIFRSGLDSSLYSDLHGDLDLWVLFAKQRKVEELFIHLPYDYRELSENVYEPPQCLYECSSLTKLSLIGCNIQISGNVQWNQLKSLTMYGFGLTEDVINRVVSSAPKLKSLRLFLLGSYQNLTIRSSSLKRLTILSSKCDPSNHTVLTIWAPNLEALEISRAPYSKCFLIDVSSLTEVTFKFLSRWAAVVGETLSQILPTIQHVETVTLSECCFKMLVVMKGKYPFPPLLKVKLLKISSGLIEPNDIVGLLEIFPKLKRLVIDWTLDAKKQDIGEPFKFDAENYAEPEANILKSFLLQLRTFEITWYSYEASIFELIEFLLNHGTIIEKVVIQKRGNQVVESEDMFLAAQKVVSLQRSFPTAELILCNKK